jgi:hypothetical protein
LDEKWSMHKKYLKCMKIIDLGKKLNKKLLTRVLIN